MRTAFRLLLVVAAVLYLAIAAYGHYSKTAAAEKAREEFCPCDQCDCAAPAPEGGSANG
ncbi:MAG: hypothetical protein HOQ02_04610 [Lysobacter sp.]|nr:hypothetical protein [Lysobacter sp.]